MRVLVAHLDPGFPGRAREWLTPLGYEVDGVVDLASARSALAREAYDVVLADVRLTPASPAELLIEIKTGPRGYTTAVVLMAGEFAFDEAMSALGRGAHDFLKEPVDPVELVARVQSAVQMTALRGELLTQSRRLEMLVYQDALTGLFNRRFMFAQLSALISGARRHGRPVTVVMIDMDRFKALNDTHGHEAGDRALIAVATALRDRLRGEDYIGRLGGEEFLALLPDTGEAEAEAVAESLRRCVSQVEIATPEGGCVSVTASVGWATWAGETPEELVRRADRALYAAKDAGRDLVRRG